MVSRVQRDVSQRSRAQVIMTVAPSAPPPSLVSLHHNQSGLTSSLGLLQLSHSASDKHTRACTRTTSRPLHVSQH